MRSDASREMHNVQTEPHKLILDMLLPACFGFELFRWVIHAAFMFNSIGGFKQNHHLMFAFLS